MNIGVIGLRSKHLRFFQEALAGLYPAGEHRITHICGCDAPELVPHWPGLIPCTDIPELVNSVDAVIIALREGYQHAAPAALALDAGKPVFIDKPFTCDPREARAIRDLAAVTGTPCTGGSTICFTKTVQLLKTALPHREKYVLSYQADPFSPFGGWYFYGSHLTDLCVSIFGPDWQSVTASLSGSMMTAQVRYPSFTVTLRSTPEVQPPLLTADKLYTLDDRDCYSVGMAHFIAVAQGQEPGPLDALVRSTELMEAILTAAAAGQPYPG